MSLYFMRHGETDDNVRNVFTGQKDVALTERGHEEARAAVPEVAKLGIQEIISSDLSRARETAAIIADGIGLSREHVRANPDAREVDVGDLVGEPMDQQRLRDARGTNPTVETIAQIEARLHRLLQTINPDVNTLIVGHNGSGRILMSLLSGQNSADIPMLPNCQVFKLAQPKDQA